MNLDPVKSDEDPDEDGFPGRGWWERVMEMGARERIYELSRMLALLTERNR